MPTISEQSNNLEMVYICNPRAWQVQGYPQLYRKWSQSGLHKMVTKSQQAWKMDYGIDLLLSLTWHPQGRTYCPAALYPPQAYINSKAVSHTSSSCRQDIMSNSFRCKKCFKAVTDLMLPIRLWSVQVCLLFCEAAFWLLNVNYN